MISYIKDEQKGNLYSCCFFGGSEGYYVSYSRITELTIIEPSLNLYCNNNLISFLVLKEGFTRVCCFHNNISSLIIPSTVRSITCDLMNGIEEQYNQGMYMQIFQKR